MIYNRRTVIEVLEAWTNPGKNPRHHRQYQEQLRREWPVLAQALDKLASGK